MADWLRLVVSRPVVRRALKYALFVGTILIGINHGDLILRGNLETGSVLKMVLTMLVPYLVSTFSSVAAMREMERSP